MPKVSEYQAITGANISNSDEVYVVDVGSPNAPKKAAMSEFVQAPAFSSRYAPIAASSVWVPASNFLIGNEGAPTYGSLNAVPALLFDASLRELILFTFYPPQHWNSYNIDAYWSNAGAGSGDVYFEGYRQQFGNTDTAGSTASVLIAAAVTAPAQNVCKVSRLNSSAINMNAGDITSVLFGRKGSEAADTLGNDIGVFGVLVSRAS